MLKPPALRAGDRLAVVAAASGFDRSEFDRGLAEIRALGFEPVYDERVFERSEYVAGEAARRADAFLTAWRDPTIAGIVGARGGYGSVHVLPYLAPDVLRRTPKVLIGYSDLTSLLSYLTTGCGIVGFHGPTVVGRLARGTDGYDRDSLCQATTRVEPLGELPAAGVETVVPGEAVGTFFGGTLTQLVASFGTPYAFAPEPPYVLLLDEVRERPYRIDRMLTQLRLSGLLERASGIVLGELPGCDEPTGHPTARGVVADLLADFPGPVVFGFPTGHTRGPALTVPLGVEVRLVAGAHPRLIVEEAAVS